MAGDAIPAADPYKLTRTSSAMSGLGSAAAVHIASVPLDPAPEQSNMQPIKAFAKELAHDRSVKEPLWLVHPTVDGVRTS